MVQGIRGGKKVPKAKTNETNIVVLLKFVCKRSVSYQVFSVYDSCSNSSIQELSQSFGPYTRRKSLLFLLLKMWPLNFVEF